MTVHESACLEARQTAASIIQDADVPAAVLLRELVLPFLGYAAVNVTGDDDTGEMMHEVERLVVIDIRILAAEQRREVELVLTQIATRIDEEDFAGSVQDDIDLLP